MVEHDVEAITISDADFYAAVREIEVERKRLRAIRRRWREMHRHARDADFWLNLREREGAPNTVWVLAYEILAACARADMKPAFAARYAWKCAHLMRAKNDPLRARTRNVARDPEIELRLAAAAWVLNSGSERSTNDR